jgi:oxygen-independent coproporphyrinogen-3 oxidase
MRGIYVHLPFCPYICPYCDFAKWPHKRSAAERYLRALETEVADVSPLPAQSIFYGGGTPNEYDAATISRLTRLLRERFAAPDGAHEVSIELNPELVRAGDMRAYYEAGITRVSIGVQSFVPDEIIVLGRKHTVEQVAAVVADARAAGIGSVSIDVMFAVPGQTRESWRHSLDRAIALEVDHVSTYGLTIEEGTPYAQWQAREPQAFAEDSLEADMYGIAMDTLEAAGYEQYEISNFAKPGHACLHNRNYWENGEYLGLGVGATSYLAGVRSTHTRSLQQYVDAVMRGTAIPGESESLVGSKRLGEAAMLALRTAQGVGVAAFNERYGVDFMQFYSTIIAEFSAADLLESDGRSVRLTRRGRFLANDVCGAFVTFA